MIKGLLELFIALEIFLKKLRLSFEVLSRLIEIDPIFLRYHPNIGISKSSFFNMSNF